MTVKYVVVHATLLMLHGSLKRVRLSVVETTAYHMVHFKNWFSISWDKFYLTKEKKTSNI